VKRLLYIFVGILYAAFCTPLFAQDIEYGMNRKTYEIAGIEVKGADSYEDFVLIGFSGLAVGERSKCPVRRSPKRSSVSGNKVCSPM